MFVATSSIIIKERKIDQRPPLCRPPHLIIYGVDTVLADLGTLGLLADSQDHYRITGSVGQLSCLVDQKPDLVHVLHY